MIDKDTLNQFLNRDFPQSGCEVLSVGDRSASVRKIITQADLRPGNTVSGPTMMGLADCALYMAILGHYGLIPLAVTTNLNINFLRKPSADQNITAHCRLMKTGKVLVVGEVWLHSGEDPEPVAHVTGTYSIPPARSA